MRGKKSKSRTMRKPSLYSPMRLIAVLYTCKNSGYNYLNIIDTFKVECGRHKDLRPPPEIQLQEKMILTQRKCG